MEEMITMSKKEVDRCAVLEQVRKKQLNLPVIFLEKGEHVCLNHFLKNKSSGGEKKLFLKSIEKIVLI